MARGGVERVRLGGDSIRGDIRCGDGGSCCAQHGGGLWCRLGVEGCGGFLLGPAGALGEPAGEAVPVQFAHRGESFGDGHLGGGFLLLRVGGARESQDRFGGGADLGFEEAFVDVSDLLDVKSPESEPSAFPADRDILHGAQHPQHCSVVYFGRAAGVERIARSAALQPRVALRVEEGSAVGGKIEILVFDPRMQCPADG